MKRVHTNIIYSVRVGRTTNTASHSPDDPVDPADPAAVAAAASDWDRTGRDPAAHPSCAGPVDPAGRACRPSAAAPSSRAVPAAIADPCPSDWDPCEPPHCAQCLQNGMEEFLNQKMLQSEDKDRAYLVSRWAHCPPTGNRGTWCVWSRHAD